MSRQRTHLVLAGLALATFAVTAVHFGTLTADALQQLDETLDLAARLDDGAFVLLFGAVDEHATLLVLPALAVFGAWLLATGRRAGPAWRWTVVAALLCTLATSLWQPLSPGRAELLAHYAVSVAATALVVVACALGAVIVVRGAR